MSEPACERCSGDWWFDLSVVAAFIGFIVLHITAEQELSRLKQWKAEATQQLKDHERQNEMQWRSILNLEGGEFQAKEVDDASE